MITGIINARNEERVIGTAIASLKQFASEVIVADMASTDGTRAVAARLGARVLSVPDYGLVEPAKRDAVSAATNEWVVLLDADEVIPPALAARLREIAASGDCEAVEIGFVTFMFGRRIAHTGWGPQHERHLRMFRRDSVRLPTETHTEVTLLPGQRALRLPNDEQFHIRHYNYRGWGHFMEKLNRYTTLEAKHLLDRKARLSFIGASRQAAREFARRFFYHRGFRDGVDGFLLSLLMVVYRFLVYAKARQLATVGDDQDILEVYRADARNQGVPVPHGG